MFRAAVDASLPANCLQSYLHDFNTDRLVVIGAGKAAARMAKAIEDDWPGQLSGTVVTRYGHGLACRHIEVIEAGHPTPDQAGMAATARILQRVEGLGPADVVLCLLSGGGSSLLVAPPAGVTLDDERALNNALLECGATIREINCVRRHLSRVKGGRLAAACQPARVVSLVVSDVPGDSLCDIASGPTVGDPTTCADAYCILERYGIPLPRRIREILESGEGESVKPGDRCLARSEAHLVASPQLALEAAARVGAMAGIPVHVLSDRLEGEAREVGKVLGGIALQVAQRRQPFTPPCILLSGGETTVTVRGSGRGGRNVEFALALAIALDGHPGIHGLAADTDGIDGREEIAGAYIDPQALPRAARRGIEPADYLERNDAHSFFEEIGGSIVTGPTRTNVNDFRAILIGHQ